MSVGGASWFWWRRLLDATRHSTDSECQLAQCWQRVSIDTVLIASVKWHSADSECQVARTDSECQVAQYWQIVSSPIPAAVSFSIMSPHEILYRSSLLTPMAAQPSVQRRTVPADCTSQLQMGLFFDRGRKPAVCPHINKLLLQFLHQLNWSTHFCSERAAHSNKLQVLHHDALSTAADGCI
jgi:hypothetical protein